MPPLHFIDPVKKRFRALFHSGARAFLYLKNFALQSVSCKKRAIYGIDFARRFIAAGVVAFSFARRLVFLFWSQLLQLYAVASQHAAAPKVLGMNLKHPTA